MSQVLLAEAMTDPAARLQHYGLTVPTHGAICEFGCYDGSSMRTLLAAFPGREFWAFDTFQGMPSKGYDTELDYGDPPGKWKPSTNVQQELDALGVHTVAGAYAHTLPRQDKPIAIALAYLDCDWYSSYTQALHWLASRLLPGSIVLMDDYRELAGARLAADEFFGRLNLPIIDQEYVVWSPR